MITESIQGKYHHSNCLESFYHTQYAKVSGLCGNEVIIDVYDAIADSLCRGYKIQDVGVYGCKVQDERDIDRCRRMTGDLIYGE